MKLLGISVMEQRDLKRQTLGSHQQGHKVICELVNVCKATASHGVA